MNQPLIRLTEIAAAYDQKKYWNISTWKLQKRIFLELSARTEEENHLDENYFRLTKTYGWKNSVFHQGKEVNEITMGYLPQYNTIDKKFPISVYEVVLSGLNKQKSLFRSFSKAQHDKVRETIARMGLEGLEQRAIGQLSGGQLQRALLGRALVSNPEVVILDEPNTYIDKRFEARLYALLEEINKECAIVLVSHDIGTILQNVKSIACVNGTLDYHPDTEVSAEWLEAHFECPIELLGHGNLPHRILKCHHHEE